MIRRIELLEQRMSAPYDGVLGTLPGWIPEHIQHEFYSIRDRLLDKYTPDHVIRCIEIGISEARNTKGMLSGAALDFTDRPFRFSDVKGVRDASFLVRLRMAVELGEEKGLPLLIGNEQAEAVAIGKKFRKGRKQGTGGPIRKWIKQMLIKHPTMKNRELWTAFKQKPLKGWQVMKSSEGEYLEGPDWNNVAKKAMGYKRFSNITKEERDKLKG